MKDALRKNALLMALVSFVGCAKTKAPDPLVTDAALDNALGVRTLLDVIQSAEDRRRSIEIPVEARSHARVEVRRRAARAYARIGDKASVASLTTLLVDDDSEVVGWAAYGLGYACKGREEGTVRALSARWASWNVARDAGAGRISPAEAIPRALAKCASGSSVSVEKILVRALHDPKTVAEGTLLALGDLAVKKKELDVETIAELVRLSDSSKGLSFYPLSRIPSKDPRVSESAVRALSQKGDARLFAIKTLGKNAKSAMSELEKVVLDATGFSVAERVEAARALAGAGEQGKKVLANLLVKMAPSKDPFRLTQLGGPEFHVLLQLVASLTEPPPEARESLATLAVFQPEGAPPDLLARRLEEMRCAAALAVSDGAYEGEPLQHCAPPASYVFQKSQLLAIGKMALSGARKNAWQALAKNGHIRIREQAIEMADTHPELHRDLLPVLCEALLSKSPGLVAVAADAIHSHPERTLVLTKQEIAAGLDPSSKAPGNNPVRSVDAAIEKALSSAAHEAWAKDLFETRIALMEAAASLGLPWAKEYASGLCGDENVTVREHAATALRSLGEASVACEMPSTTAPASSSPNARASKVVFVTDVGDLSITLDADLAPVTSARIVSLARSSFFKGIVVHRVVPGFVAQFGDPGGDGYGGSGVPLRCETSPVPFQEFDVGMALAGRDTGSSQIFVTLSRTPHLDGAYARIGHAEGDWSSLSEGDTIRDVLVRE